MKYLLLAMIIICFGIAANAQQPIRISQQSLDSLHLQPLRLIPENYYSTKLGFMCKKEIQLEKSTKIPLKLRLGSVEYVDKLEGKGSDRD